VLRCIDAGVRNERCQTVRTGKDRRDGFLQPLVRIGDDKGVVCPIESETAAYAAEAQYGDGISVGQP
jgi:hypothetical protein